MKYLDYDKVVPFLDKINHIKISSSVMMFNKDNELLYPKNLEMIRNEHDVWVVPIEISFREKIPDIPSGKYVTGLSDLHIFYSMRDLEALMNVPDMVEDERIEEIKKNPKSRGSIATDVRNMLLCLPFIEDVDRFIEQSLGYNYGTLATEAAIREHMEKWDRTRVESSRTLALYHKARYKSGSGFAISYGAERARFGEIVGELMTATKRMLKGRESYMSGFGEIIRPRDLSFRAAWILAMQACIETFPDFVLKYKAFKADLRNDDAFHGRKLIFGENRYVPTGEVPIYAFEYMRRGHGDYRLFPPVFAHVMLEEDIKFRDRLMEKMKDAMVEEAKRLGHRRAEDFVKDDRLAEYYARYIMGVIATARDMFPGGIEENIN